ncbi:MAG TPA: SMP-30/gluconolactonase/LRE family protein [Humisphaera sp.]|nr:SMP-30/gluconolactonase/LRE family protein [Humisphaera sp.]
MHIRSIPFGIFASIVLSLCLAGVTRGQEYKYGPDSEPHDVPHGKVEKGEIVSSKAYPGAHHDYWVYVPAQYDGKTPAAVMVFNDGGGFQNAKGAFRVPVVFDNLIAKKEMPVTIAIMVNPGIIAAADEKTQLPRYERSFQYDAVSDRYSRFLVEELLPKVAETYKLTDDPNLRGIGGSSSGGIAAFVAAWERPDIFHRVLSTIGSFGNLRGGNVLADLIRKTEPKPLRVFQQDGEKDVDIYAGSWPIANRDIAAALEFAGYQHRFDLGTTSHDSKQSGPLFPEALKWLWQDYDKPIVAGANPKQPVMEVLLPDEKWKLVSEGHKFTEGPAADSEGNVYFSDIPASQIWKIPAEGKPAIFAENTNGNNGLKIGPDGRLYGCQSKANRVVAYDIKTAKETVLAEGIHECNDLAIDHNGDIYVTEPPMSQVWHISPTGEKKIVIEKKAGIQFPNGIGFTPDQSQLVIDDTRGVNFSICQVNPDGSVSHGAPYFSAQLLPMEHDSGADGLCFDSQGRLYVTTHLGLQIFDQAGRVIGIINKPQEAKVKNYWLSNVTFGGKELTDLYITCGPNVYRRKVKVKGVLGFEAPSKPEKPRL